MGTGGTRSTAGTARSARLTATLARADDQGGTQRILRTETRRRAACARWERHRAATAHRTGMSIAPSVYRVEHRINRQCVADLGPFEGSSPHHTVLTPFVSALRLAGKTDGTVVLVEVSSGRVVARRAVASPGRAAT